jgi:heparan-alpha-glucosaminide N-acetyltransferase
MTPPNTPSTAARIDSVDTLRGLTILTMVFVNDVGPAAPAWAHHIQPPNADGMTVADVVFPSFLFIVGMSIPLALERAKQSGATLFQQLVRVFSRSLALLLMGLVELNHMDDTTLGGQWWGLLAFVSIILAWSVVPTAPGAKRAVLRFLKVMGIVGLIVLLAVYRREPVSTTITFYGDAPEWVWLRTGWWGILGLIGWAYLTASLLYLALGPKREWLMGAMATLVAIFLVDRGGGFFSRVDDKRWLDGIRPIVDGVAEMIVGFDRYVDIGTVIGSHPSITMAGCMLGTILLPRIGLAKHADRVRWAFVFAAGLFVAGLVTDTFAGINKIAATPTWCLWSAAITVLVWIGLYAIMDIKGWRAWSIVIRPAGANPLIAYLLHPILLWSFALSGTANIVLSYTLSDSAETSMFGSLVMSLSVCGLTGLIARSGLRVRI